MEFFREGTCSEIIALRLDYDDDVLKCVEAVAREADIRAGAVISGIGTLKAARLHWITTTTHPSVDEFRDFEGPYEIASISGIIADHKPHLHTCISDLKGTYDGHLEPGCKVMYLAELVIVKFGDMALGRFAHPETGTSLLRRVAQGK
jgi:predicted DNA-binding protein with PD1-like motif